jgi:mevalonate pyrophosphate decarboxylase
MHHRNLSPSTLDLDRARAVAVEALAVEERARRESDRALAVERRRRVATEISLAESDAARADLVAALLGVLFALAVVVATLALS